MKDSEVNFVSNYMIHLHALDTVLNNYHAYEYDHQEYTKYIVECLYALLNVEEVVNSKQCKIILGRIQPSDRNIVANVFRQTNSRTFVRLRRSFDDFGEFIVESQQFAFVP